MWQSWPELNFFELSEEMSKFGIGASRHCLVNLAHKICPEDFRFFFMIDDNVKAWKVNNLSSIDSPLSSAPLSRPRRTAVELHVKPRHNCYVEQSSSRDSSTQQRRALPANGLQTKSTCRSAWCLSTSRTMVRALANSLTLLHDPMVALVRERSFL